MPTARSQALADAIKARRSELNMSQQDVVLAADRAGETISINTVRVIEYGQRENPTLEVSVALAKALSWPTNAINRILMGEDPRTFETVIWDQTAVEGLGTLTPPEREIWELSSLPEQTRRELIAHLRQNGGSATRAG